MGASAGELTVMPVDIGRWPVRGVRLGATLEPWRLMAQALRSRGVRDWT